MLRRHTRPHLCHNVTCRMHLNFESKSVRVRLLFYLLLCCHWMGAFGITFAEAYRWLRQRVYCFSPHMHTHRRNACIFTFYLSVDRRMVSIKCHSGRYFKIFLLYSFFWLLGKLCSERDDNSIVTAFDSNRFVCICVISNACASLSLFISIFTNTSL